jgi:hypothetical protein
MRVISAHQHGTDPQSPGGEQVNPVNTRDGSRQEIEAVCAEFHRMLHSIAEEALSLLSDNHRA